MKKVEVFSFVAEDGTVFQNEQDCLRHETEIVWKETIEKFRDSEWNPYKAGAQKGMVSNLIAAWLNFQLSQQ